MIEGVCILTKQEVEDVFCISMLSALCREIKKTDCFHMLLGITRRQPIANSGAFFHIVASNTALNSVILYYTVASYMLFY